MNKYRLEQFFQELVMYGGIPLLIIIGLLLQIFVVVGIIILIRKLGITRRVIRQGGICAEGVSVPEHYRKVLRLCLFATT